MDRRRFLKGSILAAAAAGAPVEIAGGAEGSSGMHDPSWRPDGDVIDVNVDVCCWPFRPLPHGSTAALVENLQKHGIRQAWAGSYDAMLHKNLDASNRRLAEEVRERGQDVLVPFGAVNPAWPDWEEDLRRIDEEYGMPGIKLIPGYHGYKLDHPEFARLLEKSAERGLIVQVAMEMEDERMRHPRIVLEDVDVTPLPQALRRVPGLRIVFVNPFRRLRGDRLKVAVNETDALFGISNLDGVGGIERVINGTHWYLRDVSIPAERLVFGSHVPFFPIENVLLKFMESEVSAADRKAMLCGNAERLLRNA